MAVDVISIGMIGIPSTDPDKLLSSIQELSRMRLSAVYSENYAQLVKYSRVRKLAPCGSVCQLMQIQNVAGCIWNDHPQKAIWSLEKNSSPVLMRQQFIQKCSLKTLLDVYQSAAASHTLMIPELLHRWAPSILRLRELIATKLGPIQSLEMKISGAAEAGSTLGVNQFALLVALDLARMLLAVSEVRVHESTCSEMIDLTFLHSGDSVSQCILRIEETSDGDQKPVSSTVPSMEVQCEAGSVAILSERELQWSHAGERHSEILKDERSAEHVVLDLFGRRIAGGIVPVPDLNELFRNLRLLQAVEEVAFCRKTLLLNDASLPVQNGELCF